MSVCNIFKKPTDSQGNNQDSIFYTFSEYSNSLAGMIAGDGAVYSTPSSFIAMDLQDNIIDTAGKWLQNYYDDLCCRMRDDDTIPDHESWEMPAFFKILKAETGAIPEYVYKGDIDIISNETIDGMNWCECVCWMGPNAKRNATITEDDSSRVSYHREDDAKYISGYSSEASHRPDVSPWGYETMVVPGENTINKYTIDTVEDVKESEFKFNCVLVLFDITSCGSTIKDVPMGVYLTRDHVTKKCNDDTIYGQGSSWSVKIGMRWANTVDGSVVTSGNASQSTDEYGSFLRCIDRMNDTIDMMNEMTSTFNKMYNEIRDSIYTSAAASGCKCNCYWKLTDNTNNR